MGNETTNPEVIIYADGSCMPNPGKGGWACVLLNPAKNLRKEISGCQEKSTNNQMELTSVIEALKALKMKCMVTLRVDSQYVMNAFAQDWIGNWKANGWKNAKGKPVANKELWLELISLCEKHEIKWEWIRGHNGDTENERCDVLAKEAISTGTLI